MISRRSFGLGSLALAIAPKASVASVTPRISLIGSMEQGTLVIGETEPDSEVKINGGPLLVSKDGTFAFGFEYDQK